LWSSQCSIRCSVKEQMSSLADRLWAQVTIGAPDECWPWTGGVSAKGYARLRLKSGNRLKIRAHRAAYLVTYGEIPEDMMIMHDCDNPRCCNPRHLRAGTNAENVRDAFSRGRRPQNMLRVYRKKEGTDA
jgi:hypothetical protein